TITGAMADHRLPLRPTAAESLGRLILERLKAPAAPASGQSSVAGVPANWLAALLSDLTGHGRASLVIAGPGQPPAVHAMTMAINDALGNFGQTLTFIEPVEARPQNQLQSLTPLIDDMRAGP